MLNFYQMKTQETETVKAERQRKHLNFLLNQYPQKGKNKNKQTKTVLFLNTAFKNTSNWMSLLSTSCVYLDPSF